MSLWMSESMVAMLFKELTRGTGILKLGNRKVGIVEVDGSRGDVGRGGEGRDEEEDEMGVRNTILFMMREMKVYVKDHDMR